MEESEENVSMPRTGIGGLARLRPYDLISSPMMINKLVREQICDEAVEKKRAGVSDLAAAAIQRLTERASAGRNEERSRGESRTATTLLDSSLPRAEVRRLNEITRVRELPTGGLARRRSVSQPNLHEGDDDEVLLKDRISKYSGPLYNETTCEKEENSAASIADRLTNIRMMSRSGYTWDQNGACAKIRLGDGAILQNLYPSNSHVRLKTGVVERIDQYYMKMLDSREKMQEVALIRGYEYNQWARTKPVSLSSGKDNKPLPLDRLESKSVYPSHDTIKTLTVAPGARSKIFGYGSLEEKFSEPKFLKKMGFIQSIKEYNPIQVGINTQSKIDGKITQADAGVDNGSASDEREKRLEDDTLESDNEEELASEGRGSEEEQISEEDLPSRREVDEELAIVEAEIKLRKAELAEYQAVCTIGSKGRPLSGLNQVVLTLEGESKLMDTDTKSLIQATLADQTVCLLPTKQSFRHPSRPSSQMFERPSRISRYSNDRAHEWRQKTILPKCIRKSDSKYKININSTRLPQPLSLSHSEKQAKFSQPVCLCPKLSAETIVSLYSPSMQKYSHSNRLVKCRLHGSQDNVPRDKIILKSLT